MSPGSSRYNKGFRTVCVRVCVCMRAGSDFPADSRETLKSVVFVK